MCFLHPIQPILLNFFIDVYCNVVNDHGFSQKNLHIVARGQEPIRHEFQRGQTNQVKKSECERHLVGMHGGGESRGGIARRVRMVRPEGEEANEDGGGGVAC